MCTNVINLALMKFWKGDFKWVVPFTFVSSLTIYTIKWRGNSCLILKFINKILSSIYTGIPFTANYTTTLQVLILFACSKIVHFKYLTVRRIHLSHNFTIRK